MAATHWKNNAEMIASVHELGYLKDGDCVLDPTYGRGNWWKTWRPDRLITNDIDPDTSAMWHHDFRNLSIFDNEIFDAITFDPPYIAQGGRLTSTVQAFLTSYGLHDVPKTPSAVQQLIDDGLTEMYRLAKVRGIVVVKCKDYVNGGILWMGTHYTLLSTSGSR